MMRRRCYLPVLLCLLCATGAAGAQEIGRLFTSPDERVSLERGRFASKLPPGQTPAKAESAEPAYIPVEGDQILVVNGVVRRSGSGRETTWIDSVPHTGNDRLQGGAALAQGKGGSRVALTLRSGQRVSVKPGQNVDAVTGKVREAYQPVPPPKPRVIASPAE